MSRLVVPLPRRVNPGMNKTEQDYAALLEVRRRAGEIESWEYEGMRLRLADGTLYTPDFVVTYLDHIAFHETKGFMREAARVRLNVAAEKWWQFRFVLVQRKGKVWTYTDIGGA